jgi:hypothetical protein
MALKFLNNGYFAGKVGIGTDSLSSKLTISGQQELLQLTRGGASDSKWFFATDSAKLYIGENTSYGTGVKMTLTDAGNVGIGATSPSSKLQVSGDAYVTEEFGQGVAIANKLQTYGAEFRSGGASAQIFFGRSSNNIGSGAIGADSSYVFRVWKPTDFSNPFVIEQGGNVGIGTTSPAEKLEVSGGHIKITNAGNTNLYINANAANADATIFFEEADSVKAKIQHDASNDSLLFTDGSYTDTMTLKGGNVGIGETSPDFRLDVSKGYTSGNGKVAKFRSGNDATFVNFDTVQVVQQDVPCLAIIETSTGAQADEQKLTFAVGDNKAIIGTTSTVTNGMSFYTNRAVTTTGFTAQGNLALHLANTGNVGIGTTSPDQKLEVAGNIRIPNQGKIVFGSAGTTPTDYLELYDVNASGSLLKLVQDTNTRFVVQGVTGNVGIGTNAPTAKLHVVGTGLFTGLVSGITPVAAANFVTKAYVDGSGGGTGPFLPLAGGTMTGVAGVVFPDAFKLNLGTGSDLEIYHSGSNAFLDNDTGGLYIRQQVDNNDVYFQADRGDGNLANYFYLSGTNTNNTDTLGATIFPDKSKIFMGNSKDLEIYHDGSDSYIKDNGAGNLLITSNGASVQINKGTTENMAEFIVDGAVKLYYDSAKKLETGIVSVGAATTTGGTLIDGWITTTQANAINNTTIATTAYVNNKIALIPAGLRFEGTWDASTGNPPSASPENGQFWIVSVAGSTSLSGITDWKVGDWAIYVVAGAGTDGWQKVDNSSVLDGIGTGQTLPLWSGSGTSNTLTDSRFSQSSTTNIITGPGNAASDKSLSVTSAANTEQLYIQGTGEVVVSQNYFYVSASQGMYSNGLARFRGGITNDQNNPLLLGGNGSTANLTLTSNTSATFAGTVLIDGLSNYTGLTVKGSGAARPGITWSNVNQGDLGIIYGTENNALVIATGASGLTALTLDSSQNATFAGAGTFGGQLTVNPNASTSIRIDTAGTNAGLVFAAVGDELYLGANNVHQIRLKTNNDVEFVANATFAGDVTATANYTAGNSKIIYKAQRSGGAVAGDWSYDDATTDMSLGTSTAHSFSLKAGNARALTINTSQNATFTGNVTTGANITATGDTGNSTLTLQANTGNWVFTNVQSSRDLQISDSDGTGTVMTINTSGNVGIGTTNPTYKLTVSGGIEAGGLVTYSKVAGSLNTTGYAVAGLTAGFNGASAGFEFKCYGGTGKYQRISYSCYCDSTTWRPRKMIDEGSNTYDVVASADGTTITFTFKTRSGSQGYSPRIVVQATGHSINSTYA